RHQGRLVDKVHQIRAGETGRTTSQNLEVDVGCQRHLADVDLEHLFAARDVRVRHDDLTVETAGTQKGRVENVGTVGRRDQDDAFIGFKAVHLDEELVEGLFAFVVPAAKA